MAWIHLLLAGVLEVGFTTALRLLNTVQPGTGMAQKVGLNLVFLVLIIGSFHFLQTAIRTIPMGMAYAIWTGIGAVGTVVVGAAFFGERLAAAQVLLLSIIVACIVALKLLKA